MIIDKRFWFKHRPPVDFDKSTASLHDLVFHTTEELLSDGWFQNLIDENFLRFSLSRERTPHYFMLERLDGDYRVIGYVTDGACADLPEWSYELCKERERNYLLGFSPQSLGEDHNALAAILKKEFEDEGRRPHRDSKDES